MNLKKKIFYYKNLKVKNIYKPTLFWKNLVYENIKEIENNGLENFRNKNSKLIGFIPTHTFIPDKLTSLIIKSVEKTIKSKLNAKSQKQVVSLIKESLLGKKRALEQYSVLLTDNDNPSLYDFKESKVGNPSEQFEFDSNLFSAASLNYSTGLLFLKKNITYLEKKTYLEIGGGFGSLGEILNKKINNFKYINLDLFPQNIISEYYLEKACKTKIKNHLDYKDNNFIDIRNLKKINCLLNSDIDKLKGSIDVFINFISFQEMRLDVVRNYIEKVIYLKPKYILLRNLKEGKADIKDKSKVHVVEKSIKKNHYLNLLKKKYKLIATNIIPYGHKTWDDFNSELLLFKKK